MMHDQETIGLIARYKKDLLDAQQNVNKLLTENTQLHAQVRFWQEEANRVKAAATTAIKQLNGIANSIVTRAGKLIQDRAGHCHDCDVKALLQEIETLRPLQISSR